MTTETTPRVELDLSCLERGNSRVSHEELSELCRRARQLAAVEAFLRKNSATIRRGVGSLPTGWGDTIDELDALLRSLGIDERKA